MRNRNFNNRNGHVPKSNSLTEADPTNSKNVTSNRTGSEDHVYRSLSPTPPSSSKSSSPGAQEKSCDKEVTLANGSNTEVADDSASTASASSSSGPLGLASFVSEMKVSLSTPVLLEPEEPTKDVNKWIDNNFGKPLHNGFSLSAEHLNTNFRDPQVTIFKRPPSENGIQRKHSNHSSRSFKKPQYDPQYPFDYYLSRSDESEMRVVPSNLKCNTKWDQMSDEMWQKFQVHQQSRQTYRSKMHLWRELFNAAKVSQTSFHSIKLDDFRLQNFPLFHQKAFPKWGLFLVGSTISGFGSDTSDIDMCLVAKGNHLDMRVDPRMEAMVTLNDLKNFLTNSMSKLLISS